MPDRRRAAENNVHHIEARTFRVLLRPPQVLGRGAEDVLPFLLIDRPIGGPEVLRLSGLHFNEHSGIAVESHNVDFGGAAPCPVIARKYRKAFGSQMPMRQVLTAPAPRLRRVPPLQSAAVP